MKNVIARAVRAVAIIKIGGPSGLPVRYFTDQADHETCESTDDERQDQETQKAHHTDENRNGNIVGDEALGVIFCCLLTDRYTADNPGAVDVSGPDRKVGCNHGTVAVLGVDETLDGVFTVVVGDLHLFSGTENSGHRGLQTGAERIQNRDTQRIRICRLLGSGVSVGGSRLVLTIGVGLCIRLSGLAVGSRLRIGLGRLRIGLGRLRIGLGRLRIGSRLRIRLSRLAIGGRLYVGLCRLIAVIGCVIGIGDSLCRSSFLFGRNHQEEEAGNRAQNKVEEIIDKVGISKTGKDDRNDSAVHKHGDCIAQRGQKG